jgi:hypothetical protein
MPKDIGTREKRKFNRREAKKRKKQSVDDCDIEMSE